MDFEGPLFYSRGGGAVTPAVSPGQAGCPHPVEDGEGGQRAVRGLPSVHRGAAEPRGELRRGGEEGAACRCGEFPGVLAAPLPAVRDAVHLPHIRSGTWEGL